MGLFSGKTKITVSSLAYNVAGDAADRQNFLKQSLIYLNASEQSIGDKLPRMYLQSLGVKLKRAYKHAAQSEQGLPTASVQLWQYQDFENTVQTMLNQEYGVNKFKVLDAYIEEGNASSTIEKYLNKTYGWDAITGKMTKPPAGFASNAVITWYLDNKPPTYTKDGELKQPAGTSRGYRIEFRHLAANVEPDLVVTVSLEAAEAYNEAVLKAMIAKVTQATRSDKTITRPFQAGDVNGTVSTPVTTTNGGQTTTTTTTVTKTTNGVTTTVRTKIVDVTTSEGSVRTYRLGTGEHPALDTIWLARAHTEQTYFPSLRFRVDNVDVMDDKYAGTESYESTMKVCKLMGIDALQIRDTINTNPNRSDIDYAFLQAGANMNTESQAEMDYLFRFWEMCMGRQTATEADLDAWEALGYENRPKPKTNTLTIQDPDFGNGAYKVTIQWDWIKKTTINGTISATAKVGQLDIVRGTTVQYEFNSSSTQMMDSTVVSIRRQISATQYEQVAISGAIHKNDVYLGKTVETLAGDARSNPTEHEGFIVPLHMGIFGEMPMTKRTQLAQECLYVVFNCYVITKQKWYQTGAFKWILAIILIIITICTWGTATPATTGVWGAYIGAMAAAIGVSYAVLSFIASAIIGYLVSYLMGKWAAGFASVFGKKWAGVVMAIISIVVSAYTGGNGFSSSNWLQTAVKIIDIASSLFAAYAKGAMVERQEEYDAFIDKAEEDKKLLDKLSSEFFGENDLVSIDYLLQLQKTLREDSPTTFLSRTLMTGSDVADITLGQISEMVSMNTTPRLEGIFL